MLGETPKPVPLPTPIRRENLADLFERTYNAKVLRIGGKAWIEVGELQRVLFEVFGAPPTKAKMMKEIGFKTIARRKHVVSLEAVARWLG